MTEPRPREGTLFVSIQRVDEQRHLAWGALISKDVVVVDLPEWPAKGRLEVLLASAGDAGLPVVERIAMSKVEIVGVEGRPEASIAAVRLAHDSRQVPTVAEFDLDAVQRALAEDTDIWRGLERLGYLPRGIRDLDPQEVLRQVAEWESRLREELVVDRRPLSVDEVGLRICCFWRCNRCHTPF